MEILIVAMLMTVVVKRGVEDVWHTARGNTPQRYVAASARKKSGAAGRYWGALWDDTWSDLHKRHVAKRADPSRPRGAATVFWSNLWRDGWVAAERRRQGKATRPRPETVTVPGSVVPDFEDEQQDGPDFRPDPVPHVVPTEDGRTDLRFGEDEDDPTGVSSCPECGGTAVTEDGVCLSCRSRQEQRNQHHEQQEDDIKNPDAWIVDRPGFTQTITTDPEMYQNLGYQLTPVKGHPEQGGFRITEFLPIEKTPDTGTPPPVYDVSPGWDNGVSPEWNRPYEEAARRSLNNHIANQSNPHQEGPTMTATTIEVVGLESGITFSETSAQAYTAMVGNIEQTLAALSGFDVGGPAAAAASAAMEQSAAAAQSMLTLAEELKKHRGVAEAIDATPGAGKREFYTAGR